MTPAAYRAMLEGSAKAQRQSRWLSDIEKTAGEDEKPPPEPRRANPLLQGAFRGKFGMR
jgi:hypothetical protein